MRIFRKTTTTLLGIVWLLLLVSCSSDVAVDREDNLESLMTQSADSLVIIDSKMGSKSYRFKTPLVESYDYAKEPYREFRKGIDITTYVDSTGAVESTLIADYAIYFERRKLWEAKGNVVATNVQGHILETQQLFWNQITGRIYSNVDSKITQGEDVVIGVSFESDEKFEDWEIRSTRLWLGVEEPSKDSTAVSSSAGDADFVPPPPASVEGSGRVVNPVAAPRTRTLRKPDPGRIKLDTSHQQIMEPLGTERLQVEQVEQKKK